MIFFPAQQDYSMELYASMHSIILQHLQIFVTKEQSVKLEICHPKHQEFLIIFTTLITNSKETYAE